MTSKKWLADVPKLKILPFEEAKKIGTQSCMVVSLSRRCTKSGCCRFLIQHPDHPPAGGAAGCGWGAGAAAGAFFTAGFLAGFFAGFFTAFLAAFLATFLTGFFAGFLAGFFAAFLAAFLTAFFTTCLATFETSLLKDNLGAPWTTTCYVTDPRRTLHHNTKHHVPVSAISGRSLFEITPHLSVRRDLPFYRIFTGDNLQIS